MLVLPFLLARGFVEAQYPFDSRELFSFEVGDLNVIAGDVIGHDHDPIGNRWPRISPGHFGPPADFESVGWEPINNARIAPNIVALRPHPLRPVVRRGYRRP